MDQPPQEMTWILRCMAGAAGAIASLFALFLAPPKDKLEFVVRFCAGFFFAASLSGLIIAFLHLACGIDSVLFVGVATGLCCWWVAIAVVGFSKSGGLAAWLAQRLQANSPKPKDEG